MNKKAKILGALIFPLFLLTIIGGCSKKEEVKKESTLSKTELIMGTVIKVSIYDSSDEKILNDVFKRVREIEDLVSINKIDTELDEINNNAGIKPVKVSDESFEIIEKALDYSKQSKGGYDLTIGPLVKLWSIGLPEAKVPSDNEIKEVLEKIDYNKVKLNKENKEVYLEEKGMKLDLGSIAKGYTADEIVKILKSKKVNKAIIDLGGNIYALGEKEENKPWKIGVQNPFEDRGDVVGTIDIKDKSIVTSGIYERYIEKDGEKYHHILNPKTGYPYESEIAGVTLITDKSIDGDALSTLIFTKGIKEGLEFLKELKDVEAIFVSKEKKVYLTEGIKDNFKMINTEFVLAN